MRRSFVSLLSVLFLFLNQAFCQTNDAEKYIEFESLKQLDDFKIFTLGDEKLISSYLEKGEKNSFKIHVQLRNKDLEIIQKQTLSVSESFKYRKTNFYYNYSRDKQEAIILLYTQKKKGLYEFIHFNCNNGLKITRKQGAIGSNILISDVKSLGKNLYVKTYQDLYVLDMETNNVSLHQVKSFKKTHYIEDIQLVGSHEEKELWVEYYYLSGSYRVMQINRFDSNGKELSSFDIVDNERGKKLNITHSKTKTGKYFSTGTYTQGSRSKRRSIGVFVINYKTNGEIEFQDYINFLDLENYTDFMSVKKEEKLDRKHAKKKSKGKEVNLKELFTVHEMLEKDGEYILLAEAYEPTYRTESYQAAVTDANGNTTWTTKYRQVFDGYLYSHGLVISFDEEGNRVWDKAFALSVYPKPFRVKHNLRPSFEGKQLKLIYLTSGQLASISFYKGEVVSENMQEADKVTYQKYDKVKYAIADVIYWYGKSFISYGEMRLKNKKDKTVAKNRYVYYINKITFL